MSEGIWLSEMPQQPDVQQDKGILFALNSATSESRIFSVVAVPVRLIAFGLQGADSVQILRVWLPANTLKRDSCGVLQAAAVPLEKPYTINGRNIYLNGAKNELVLDGAGQYRLRFHGDNRPDVQVVYQPDVVVRVNDSVRGIGEQP